MKSMYLWDYSSNEIRDMVHDHIIFQPVASVEQHGPHLPLGTDSFICQDITDRLMRRFQESNFPALFLPFLPYGKSNEHADYPGTITFSAQTYMSVLMDIGRSCAQAGFKKFVFINGHGGNQEILSIVCRELRIETGMQTFALQPLIRLGPNLDGILSPYEKKVGIHAGRLETSLIMHLHPTLVHSDKMEKDYSVDFSDYKYIDHSGKVSFGWKTRDVSKIGTIGDPTGANPEEGARILEDTTQVLYEACLDIQNFELL